MRNKVLERIVAAGFLIAICVYIYFEIRSERPVEPTIPPDIILLPPEIESNSQRAIMEGEYE